MKVTIKEEWVNCNKPSCTMCPHAGYWKAFASFNGKLSSIYLGKDIRFPMLIIINNKWKEFLKSWRYQ